MFLTGMQCRQAGMSQTKMSLLVGRWEVGEKVRVCKVVGSSGFGWGNAKKCHACLQWVGYKRNATKNKCHCL